MEHFGELASEKLVEENRICREILKEINTFGISNRQRLFLIYLLSLELEDIFQMKELSTLVRSFEEKIIIASSEGDEE